jgi:hypothetical protein
MGHSFCRAFVVVLAILVSSGPAAAQKPGDIFVAGAGIHSCGKFLEARRGPAAAEAEYANWTSGYLTGVNWMGGGGINKALESTDLSGRMAWLEKHCREKPLVSFFDAVSALVLELNRRPK